MTTVSISVAPSPHQRALDDLLQAERGLRQAAEQQISDYGKLLTEVASALAGERLEEARLGGPDATKSWGVQEWRRFFSTNVLVSTGWGHDTASRREIARLETALQELQQENQALKRENQTLKTQAQAARKTGKSSHAPKRAGFTVSHAAILKDLGKLGQTIAKQASRLDVNLGASPTSRARALQFLYLACAWGISTRIEIGYLLARRGGTSPNSAGGKAKKVEARLVQAGLLETQSLAVPNTDVLLAAVRPTQAGSALCARLGWQPVTPEWERFEDSAAYLGFLLHARIRGYAVSFRQDRIALSKAGRTWTLAAGRIAALDPAQVAVVDLPGLFDVRLAEAHDAPLFAQ